MSWSKCCLCVCVCLSGW